MEKILEFDSGIIEGIVMREIVEIFPELSDNFKQRKSFDEYYFTSKSITFGEKELEKLDRKCYTITLAGDYIKLEY